MWNDGAMGAWWLDRVLPGLIDAIPFILVVGFGFQWHRRTLARTVSQLTDDQTAEIVRKLKGDVDDAS